MATKAKSKFKFKAVIYRSRKNKLWYGAIYSSNGKQVWRTGDGYERIRGALAAIASLNSPVIELPAENIGFKR